MATSRHPLTGVELNSIEVVRPSLNFDEAVTAIILKQKGVKYQSIAHRLGTNTARLGEVFRGEIHPAAAMEALRLLSAQTGLSFPKSNREAFLAKLHSITPAP